jgi:large subunit ribosomal protein L21
MYAIIETGGKQYKVAVGDKVKVEKLVVNEGEEVVFDKIVAVKNDDGLKAGAPYVEGAKVVGEVAEQGRNKKIVVVHYKAKKNIRKKNGHRQPYTEVLVKDITL